MKDIFFGMITPIVAVFSFLHVGFYLTDREVCFDLVYSVLNMFQNVQAKFKMKDECNISIEQAEYLQERGEDTILNGKRLNNKGFFPLGTMLFVFWFLFMLGVAVCLAFVKYQ